MNKELLKTDPHLSKGCVTCHKGNPAGSDKTLSHTGMVKRPSDNPEVCGTCHGETAKTYKLSLHYTTAGFRNGVAARFSEGEKKTFDAKVFEQSCRSCHASCGDCHVKSPIISGVNLGLIDGHKFVKKDEGKTCALCHGGRVYPEFTGEYGGTADVHYQKGMMCVDCHSKTELHGDGKSYSGRREVAGKPECAACHKPGEEKSEKASGTHSEHGDAVSCSACHSSSAYRNCSDCHLGKGATATPGIILGKNPRKPDQVTTLRLIPTVRDTFAAAGVKQEKFDSLPNYWDTIPHNTRKRTDRTRECEVCHDQHEYFLKEETMIKGGSEANKGLIRKW